MTFAALHEYVPGTLLPIRHVRFDGRYQRTDQICSLRVLLSLTDTVEKVLVIFGEQ
jgi:hypothetical protein